MALPPTIPTSFVPRSASSDSRHVRTDFGNVFSFLAYAIFALVFISAIGVFFYGRILAADLAAKDAELAEAEKSIDVATVESFVQLRDRLESSKTLLEEHKAFSGFFTVLQSILPSSVRLTSLNVSVDTDGNTATVDGGGVAKSFNALSVASASFAKDGRIKDVIFSKMSINKDRSVSFTLSATLDKKIIAFSPSVSGSDPVAPDTEQASVSTTTPSI